jgi:hypothetical protein
LGSADRAERGFSKIASPKFRGAHLDDERGAGAKNGDPRDSRKRHSGGFAARLGGRRRVTFSPGEYNDYSHYVFSS